MRFGSSYGHMSYVRIDSKETNNTINIMQDPATWAAGMLNYIAEVKRADPNFRICIVSQLSKQAMGINEDMLWRYPWADDQYLHRFRQRND